jgi:hypothetical protein
MLRVIIDLSDPETNYSCVFIKRINNICVKMQKNEPVQFVEGCGPLMKVTNVRNIYLNYTTLKFYTGVYIFYRV